MPMWITPKWIMPSTHTTAPQMRSSGAAAQTRGFGALLAPMLMAFALGAGLSAPAVADTEARCGRCGDGYCNPSCGETATNCPRDCGVVETSAR